MELRIKRFGWVKLFFCSFLKFLGFCTLIIGETASAYGGGAPEYSNKFISTFIWLDKLGLSARNGIDLIVRQSFFKGYYALLYNDYSPAPVRYNTFFKII